MSFKTYTVRQYSYGILAESAEFSDAKSAVRVARSWRSDALLFEGSVEIIVSTWAGSRSCPDAVLKSKKVVELHENSTLRALAEALRKS